MSTYGLDAKNILKLDKGAPNTLTIFPGGTGDEDIVALDDKDILQLNVPADVLTIFPGGADDTIALDDKPILGLTLGATVLTLFPGGVTDDKVAIAPDLPAGATTGKIIYRQTTGGHLANVTVNPPLYFRNGDLSTYGHIGKEGTGTSRPPPEVRVPNVVPTNMILARTRAGQNYITRDAEGLVGFLPGGDWTDATTTNMLPETCNSFQFLEVRANMDAVDPGGTGSQAVYLPCYYNP